jgi:signal transduction histidine kinase
MVSKLIFKDHKYNLLTILIICILAIALTIFLGFKSNEEVQSIVQEQFNEQQLLLARQSTDGIEEFLNQKTTIIEILANEISDKSPGEVVTYFVNVYNETTDIHVIEFINESGIVTLGYPEENIPFGYDLYENNQEGAFERARNNKETYISSPTFLLEGGMGVFIWTPVYGSDEFKGVVLVIIRISDISDRFLKNNESPREIYMIDKRGTILYDSSNRFRRGRNYLERIGNESPELQQILHHQMNGSEGTGVYIGMNGSEKRLIAYSPIHWRNQLWSVAVTSPVSEVDTLINSVYVKQGVFIGVSGIFLLMGSFSIILLLTRWNKSLELEVASKTSEITKSNELLKQANKKLMELDKLKSDFVSMVSHELKTPLTPMKTSAEFLLQSDPDVNIRKEMLELIIRNIDRQTRMVNDMLDISRIESGNMRFRKEILDIGEIINSAIETMKKQSEEKKINITTDIPNDLLKINADKDKLMQVFVNLLSNALKFTHDGGNVEIKAFESEKYIEVSVKDDGIGIPPDKVDKIFNKFYQIDNTSARPYGGSGLGLAIIKSIMEGHGGTIRVESTPGEGSIFILTFFI